LPAEFYPAQNHYKAMKFIAVVVVVVVIVVVVVLWHKLNVRSSKRR